VCGILATIGIEPSDDALDVVAHRGPDGRGWRVFASCAGAVTLGHRRLAIIDTSDEALQPMSYADERFWLVCNGEIYNYLELRAGLEKEGFAFRTCSDSEVILAAYARWGEACLERLWGMFAFVIWDRARAEVFAARDRFGIKPLYWFADAAGLAFASEIKQLATLPGFGRGLNRQRAWDFLAGGLFDHTEETLFESARQLRGGECVLLDLSRWQPGQPLPIRRWYALPEPGSLRLGEAEAGRRLHDLLLDSVKIHLRADVQVGSCLSGGLDSSAIVCLAHEILQSARVAEPMHTVSACYDEARVDERTFVAEVVAATGVRSTLVFPRPEALGHALERLIWHQDEPFGSTSVFAQWVVFERARREGIKVMLDGQGADELLGGYHGMFVARLESLLRRGRLVELLRTMWARQRTHGHGWYAQLHELAGARARARLRWLIGPAVLQRPGGPWLEGTGWAGCGRALAPFGASLVREGVSAPPSLGALCRAHVMSTNLPMLLHYEDRNSMAHGVEARVPFLDHRVVELCIALGDEHKMKRAETKRALRVAMQGVLPERVRTRQDKLGFSTPEREWLSGPLRAFVDAGVREALVRFGDLFDAARVRELAGAMLDGGREVDFTLWRIVSLGAWGARFGVGL